MDQNNSVSCSRTYVWNKVHISRALLRRFLFSDRHMLSWCKRKCNFIFTHDTSTGFSAPIFWELTNDQQHYFQTSCMEFLSNRKANVGNYSYSNCRTSPVSTFYRNRARSVENASKAGFLLRISVKFGFQSTDCH
jgi:hypothetical protein